MIDIIESKSEWCALLEQLDFVDFYHTYDYHQLDNNKGDRPILIKYTEDDVIIAFPLLIRKIEGTSYFDATSVYGYPGPISKNLNNQFDNTLFLKQLKTLMNENNIISIFTRLNPFISNQNICLKNEGKILTLGNVVNINLATDLEDQYQQYQKRLKTYINKSKRLCTVKKASTKEDLCTFVKIYHETMQRVHAKPAYFFPKAYFDGLMSSKEFKTEILIALDNETGKVIAGVLFIKKGEIVQYHLSCAKKKYMHLNAVKLLIDTIRIQAHKENYKYLNLGGGVGSEEDSLFRFKNSFSKDLKSFQVWNFIANESVYDILVNKRQKRPCAALHNNCTIYFPCYRCAV